MTKVCCVDFDNTITKSDLPFFLDVLEKNPQPGVAEALQEIKNMGYEIHIFSCRTCNDVSETPAEKMKQIVKMTAFLEKHNIPYNQILNENKPIAYAYIDDRGVAFRGDWVKALKDFKELVD